MEFMGIDPLLWIMIPVGAGVAISLLRDAAQTLINRFASRRPEDQS